VLEAALATALGAADSAVLQAASVTASATAATRRVPERRITPLA
jgi:hypothetical protein